MALYSGRLLGIVGGLGPEATLYYVRLVDEEARRLCGGRVRFVVYSLVLEEVCNAARARDWVRVASLVGEALDSLAAGGVGVALIAANTPHVAWDLILEKARSAGVELVSIVDAGVGAVEALGASRVGLIATRATLESGIYQEALKARGVEVVEPPHGTLEELDAVIERYAGGLAGPRDYEELLGVARGLTSRGAEALLLACTDLGPLASRLEVDVGVPVVDPSREQVRRALELAYPECSRRGS